VPASAVFEGWKSGDEGREPARAVLQVAQVHEVLDALLERLHVPNIMVAVVRMPRPCATSMTSASPRSSLGDPDDLAHAVGEDLRPPPGWNRVPPPPRRSGRVRAQPRDLADVLTSAGLRP